MKNFEVVKYFEYGSCALQSLFEVVKCSSFIIRVSDNATIEIDIDILFQNN